MRRAWSEWYWRPRLPVLVWGQVGPQTLALPPQPIMDAKGWGGGAVSEGLRLPRPQRARCLIKGKQGLCGEGAPPTCLVEAGTVGSRGLRASAHQSRDGGNVWGIGPSSASPATLCLPPAEG